MKTKEEVIKEAWNNKELRLKDGWLYIGYCCNGWDDVSEYLKGMEMSTDRNNYDLDFYDHDNGDWGSVSVRPKSLQGFEDNNGWVKIESEDDLPIKGEYYWTVTDKNPEPIERWFNKNWMINNDDGIITHYQPIVKPKPPLY